jgi:hypothetical protein
LLLLLSPIAVARADENSDLDMIPGAVNAPAAAAEPAAAAGGKVSLEDAVLLGALRPGLVVPLPGTQPPRWENRTSLDGRWQWDLGHDVSATFSDRMDLFERNGQDFGTGTTAANDLREAYMTWEAAPRVYLEAGRINLRNGVALGYNPTDFFRAGTLIDQATADPSALRENRLGTVMLHAQQVADWGAVSLAYAPKLYDPTRLGLADYAPLDPHIDRTNASDRLLLTLHRDIGDVAPELLVYHDGAQTRLGSNISVPVGQQVIAYAEWSGGPQRRQIAEAVAYGIRTGTLPATTPVLPAGDNGWSFQNDVAAGFSWTGESKLTINLEYIFHEAGMTRGDWQRWFALGHGSATLAGLMWYERGYAADQQVPVARQQMFLRATLPDAIARDVDLTGLTFVSLDDGSAYAQGEVDWNIDRIWSAGFYVGADLGPPRSAYGSLKSAVSVTAQVKRYF